MNLIKTTCRTALAALVIFFAVVLSFVPSGCRSSQESLELISGDFSSPHIKSCTVLDPYSVELCLTKTADLNFISLETGENPLSVNPLELSFSDDGLSVVIKSSEKLSVGKTFVLAGELYDRHRNSLTFSIPLLGYNDRVPSLAFSEVRNIWKNSSGQTEYVEFYALTGGNLSGLVFETASKGSAKRYAFPCVEVSAGEYIVLHLQTPNEDGVFVESAVDETESDLSLSYVHDVESPAFARDLWAPFTTKTLAATDILVLRDMNNNGRIIDCLAYFTQGKESQWDSYCLTLAKEIEEAGLWLNADGEVECSLKTCADISDIKSAFTKSLSKKNVESLDPASHCGTASDWYVTPSKGFSPGKKN